MKQKIYWLVIIILFIAHAMFGVFTIKKMSPTYDEHVHLTAGYSYWKMNDYRLNTFDHPPLAEMWAAIPLLFYEPGFPSTHPYWNSISRFQYPFSDIFMYKNVVNAEKMLNSGRLMILVFSMLLGLLIFLWTKQLFGKLAALIAVFFWSFSSTFIAHGTLVTTDMALALFYFAVFYALHKFVMRIGADKRARKETIFVGLVLGLVLASKYSAVVVFPAIGLILLWYVLYGKLKPLKLVSSLFLSVLLIFVVLIVVYRFNSLNIYFWEGMNKVLNGVETGRSSFLFGKYSITGWRYYFPTAFLIKTPLAFTIILISAIFFKSLWKREVVLFIMWPAVFYFALACYSKVNIGHRHILPVYPFLFVLAAGGAAAIINAEIGNRKKERGFKPHTSFLIPLSMLFIWYAAAAFKTHPWHLAYFNELAGGPENGYKYMTDSNVDWGQGLKELGEYLKNEQINGVYFSYFGTGDPHYYGIKYYPIGFIDNISGTSDGLRYPDKIDFNSEKKVLFCISVTNLQATYYAQKNVFAWLNDISYEAMIADSILVYDLSKYPEQYEYFKKMFQIGYSSPAKRDRN